MEKAYGLYDPSMDKDACGVGFIADKFGEKSHQIVVQGLTILKNLEHRGAQGEDPLAGDGAGIMIQIPHEFFAQEAQKLGFSLPDVEEYGVGTVFLPQDPALVEKIKQKILQVMAEEELRLIAWRPVPTDNNVLSKNMLSMEPRIEQFFIANNDSTPEGFERNLYILRRLVEKEIAEFDEVSRRFFYVSLISCTKVIYKGMLMASQLETYFPDLQAESMKTAIAVVHQRYSTNTFPSWGLAHPFRFASHNGEINTLQGNINWSISRNEDLTSSLFGKNLKKVLPVIAPGGSDSSSFDNTLEILVHAGRSMEHAMHIMMPPAWENDETLSPAMRAFYTYSSTLMEPWDGPAAIAFCDGLKVGAMLDRNGLRPLRYTETIDGLFILASETGVLPLPASQIKAKGKIGPGEMVLVDTIKGAVLYDKAIKEALVSHFPYQQWVEDNLIDLSDLVEPAVRSLPNHEEIVFQQQVFSYTSELCQLLLKPMAEKADETTYAMGTDTPLAILSKLPKTIYSYFKQKFAQVTNPAIDSIREEVVMSLRAIVGGSYNLLEDNPRNCRMLEITQPILTNSQLEQLRNLNVYSFRAIEVSLCYSCFEMTLETALEKLCQQVEERVDEGYRIVVLSDRGFSKTQAPIPALLATAAVHHHLIRAHKRGRVGLIIETGDALEVHHFACLIGYGAGAINPYLAFDSIIDMEIAGELVGVDQFQAQMNYVKAIQKGLKKVFAKMGISTFLSYQGAQIFEVIGLNSKVIDYYFTGTNTAIEGVGLEGLESDLIKRHRLAYSLQESGRFNLLAGGEYNWRKQGEYHAYNPETIHLLQQASWHNDPKIYADFQQRVNETDEDPWTIRSLLDFDYGQQPPVPLEEVESIQSIMKRFSGGAMSIGAISREAHETLAIAFNRIGGRSNTGEGGEDESRYIPEANGFSKRSAIKQVASGRFGVTSHYLVNADELQIKIAQGAKPGEGGQLPGFKVDEYIGRLRHTIPGVTLISPPPHHDIYSIEDLSQLIFDLKNANPQATVSVKLVASSGIGAVAAGVAKAKADSITIAGYEGGTGASPATSIKHAGVPWELGLAESQQALVANNLRGKVRLQVDGQIKTGRDVMLGALLGADEFGFATALLVTAGCIMMRKCHLNTCPVGIATQNKDLRKKFHGKPEYVINYLTFVAEEVRQIMSQLGFKRFDDLIGQVQFLKKRDSFFDRYKLGIDLKGLLTKVPSKDGVYSKAQGQQVNLDKVLDQKMIVLAEPALRAQEKVSAELTIRNSDRTVGAMLGGVISKKYGSNGLPEDTIQFTLTGTAGQSFGAFVPNGVTLKLIGDANDYVGKSLSGGKIILTPPADSLFQSGEAMIAGNTCLYGATSGKAFFSGLVGQRFAVRNSGALAVVEGVGDHACEYMTGGRVVILGSTGKNFGAGMSGGLAYVLDPMKKFKKNCNPAMVEVEQLVSGEHQEELKLMLKEHYINTGSRTAKVLLENFTKRVRDFVIVIPFEYRRILAKEYYTRKAS